MVLYDIHLVKKVSWVLEEGNTDTGDMSGLFASPGFRTSCERCTFKNQGFRQIAVPVLVASRSLNAEF